MLTEEKVEEKNTLDNRRFLLFELRTKLFNQNHSHGTSHIDFSLRLKNRNFERTIGQVR